MTTMVPKSGSEGKGMTMVVSVPRVVAFLQESTLAGPRSWLTLCFGNVRSGIHRR